MVCIQKYLECFERSWGRQLSIIHGEIMHNLKPHDFISTVGILVVEKTPDLSRKMVED